MSRKETNKPLLTSFQGSSSRLIIDVVDITDPGWTAVMQADPKSVSRTL